jgi:hypothetical protein
MENPLGKATDYGSLGGGNGRTIRSIVPPEKVAPENVRVVNLKVPGEPPGDMLAETPY